VRIPSLILIILILPLYYITQRCVLQGLGEFRLGWVRLGGRTVGKICFVLDFILPNAYTVDACSLTIIQPSLSFIDMTYCTPDTKATPASVRVVGVDF
jgi:hypothetical protein